MNYSSQITALALVVLAGCSSEGPTRPDWDKRREPPNTIEAKIGAKTYVCIREPGSVVINAPPVYRCQ